MFYFSYYNSLSTMMFMDFFFNFGISSRCLACLILNIVYIYGWNSGLKTYSYHCVLHSDLYEAELKEKRQKKVYSGFLAPLPLSHTLIKFLGTGESALTRADVIKRVWEYIKINNLQVICRFGPSHYICLVSMLFLLPPIMLLEDAMGPAYG